MLESTSSHLRSDGASCAWGEMFVKEGKFSVEQIKYIFGVFLFEILFDGFYIRPLRKKPSKNKIRNSLKQNLTC